MKKILVVFLAVALIVSAMPFAVSAAGNELPSMTEYDGTGYTNIDTVFKDEDEPICEIGIGREFLAECDNVIKGEYAILSVAGWVAFDQDIKSFGYRIDGGEIVYDETFYIASKEDVIAAAATLMCDYSARFMIRADVAGLLGDHVIDYVVKLADKTEWIISSMNNDLSILYSGPADPDATPTPAPQGSETSEGLPGFYFTFDEEDKYEGLFSGGKEIEDIGWDAENKCEQLLVITSEDPYITVNTALVGSDYFDEDIDLDKYKVLSIGVKLDEKHGTGGQIYYSTDENPGFHETRVVTLSYKNHTNFQALNVNFSKVKTWSGILESFRYDAFGKLDAEESVISVYYIAFFETKADAEAFAARFEEEGYDLFPAVATPTPRPTNTPTPAPTSTPEGEDTAEPAATPDSGTVTEPTKKPDSESGSSKKGCGGVIGGGAAIVAAAGIALLIRRKKH